MSKKNENEYEEHLAGMQIFFRMLILFREIYPDITKQVLNIEILRDYNFITSLEPEKFQQTMVSRCLFAADNACNSAIHSKGLFSDPSQQEETQSLHEASKCKYGNRM